MIINSWVYQDVGVNTGWPDTTTDYYKIDRRRSATLADFATSNGQNFFTASYDLEPNKEVIVDGSYRYNKSEGFFTSSCDRYETKFSFFES